MAVNMIGHPDKRRYNPGRDIAYCWPWIMRSAIDRITSGSGEPWALKVIDKYNISNEDLVKVAKGLATFMALCNDPEKCPDNPKDTVEASGLFGCSEEARLLVYSAVGETMLAAFFLAIRDVLLEDEPSPLNDKRFAELIQASMDKLCLRNESFFRRFLRKIKSWF